MHELASGARSGIMALDAVQQFFEAYNYLLAGDARPMEALWPDAPDAILMGPLGGRQVGQADVLGMFQRHAHLKPGGQVVPRGLLVRLGEELAYSACVEHGHGGANAAAQGIPEPRATNLFRIEGDDWRLIYHHADPLPPATEAAALGGAPFAALPYDSPDPDILDVMGQFSSSLSRAMAGDLQPLLDLWAPADDVSIACPGGGINVGPKAIAAELGHLAEASMRGHVQFVEPVIRVHHDLAYASCLESAPDMTVGGKPYALLLRTTTVLRHTQEQWRIVHHHADYAPGLVKLLQPA